MIREGRPRQNLEQRVGPHRKHIRLDDPTPFAKYFGCGHIFKNTTDSRFSDKFMWIDEVAQSLSGPARDMHLPTKYWQRHRVRNARRHPTERREVRTASRLTRKTRHCEKCPRPRWARIRSCSPEQWETRGALAPRVAKFVMKMLYAASVCVCVCQWDLLWTLNWPARHMTKLNQVCGIKLRRGTCRLHEGNRDARHAVVR